jgi:hypothetical protein
LTDITVSLLTNTPVPAIITLLLYHANITGRPISLLL